MALEVDELRSRLAKLASLEEAGIASYPHRYHRSYLASQAVTDFDQLSQTQQLIHIAGRLMSFRAMGRASFAHLTDSSGRMQVHFRHDVLGSDAYQGLKRLDLGDIVGVEGALFRTRTGEITVEARQVILLAKALRPPPEKWHGLVDVEKRYRQRYLDLVANPEVRHVFIKRSQIIRAIRAFLDRRGFMEVETPILQPIYGGAAARPFVTHHHALDQDFYLRIAPELYLKRLLVGGLDKVYEIGKDFRNEGISTKHNPEFTMLECYEAYGDYQSVMVMTEELVAAVAQDVLGTTKIVYKGDVIDVTPPWRRITLREAIQQQAGVDYATLPERDSLSEAARAVAPSIPPDWSRAKIIDELLSTFVEPKLIQPTFVLDYPLELSPFAKLKPGSSDTVERFEAFIGGMEIANAFSELNDPRDQRERFTQQRTQRALGDELTQEWDEDYLIALEHGMPPAGGLGVGIDRLVMLLTSQPSIREVILFPQLRTK